MKKHSRRYHLSALFIAVGLGLASASPSVAAGAAGDLFQGPAREQAAVEVERLSAIQARHESALLALPGVHGVGIGADPKSRELVFIVAVDREGKAPDLPLRIEGVDVVIDRSERPVPMHGGAGCTPCHANQVALPVPMGNSTGNPFQCFSCTLGFKACSDGVIYYVTNAHCSPNALGCPGQAPLGSNTLHRGRFDAACATTTDIGDVSWSATPVCGQNNLVDATRVISANNLTSWSIRDIGTPSTVPGTVLPGDAVRKSGRTTGYTTGTVNSVNFTTDVGPYNCCGMARFVDQIRVNAGVLPFLQGGDSGSALLNMQNPPKIVGLLFAGPTDGSYAIANKISWVLWRLDLTLDPNCQPPTCEDYCYEQWDACNEEYCYWNYNQYMCQIGCDLQLQECFASC